MSEMTTLQRTVAGFVKEDVAWLVAFLAGSEADWITGQIIHSEGGFLRR
jgi:3-oxoacyl-[acyl-carrier protein] reductase